MRTRKLIGMAALIASAASTPVAAHAFTLYHSPADDGVNPGAPGTIPIGGGNKVLNLWADNGASPTVGDPCAGPPGTGDELCMWDLHITCDSPNVTIVSFSPDPGAGAVVNQEPAFVRMNGGDPINGTLGPTPIGQLTVSATGTGNCNLVGEAWVDTSLGANAIAMAAVASACFDDDTDELCNPVDPCISFDNSGPGGLDDFNLDGIPDVCQCGDANGNNSVDGNDLTIIFGCLSGAIPPATCAANLAGGKMEGNGNLTLDSNDLTQVFRALSGLQPNSALTCANRTEGTPVP